MTRKSSIRLTHMHIAIGVRRAVVEDIQVLWVVLELWRGEGMGKRGKGTGSGAGSVDAPANGTDLLCIGHGTGVRALQRPHAMGMGYLGAVRLKRTCCYFGQ